MQQSCPDPFLFNSIKHHLGFIAEQTHVYSDEEKLLQLSHELLNIGHSPLDLYTGKLSVEDVISEIGKQLEAIKAYSRYDFSLWIRKHAGYRQMVISDGSSWTLRLHASSTTYIHIHPSRKSAHVKRITASMLKTAIICVAWTETDRRNKISLDAINLLRNRYLFLPPVSWVSATLNAMIHEIKKGNEINHCPG